MEAVLLVQRPVCIRRNFPDRTHLKIKPFLGFSFNGRTNPSSQSSLWCKVDPGIEVSYRIVASADFSRRRLKKGPIQRPKSSPKGLSPRVPIGTSTQKKDERDNSERLDSSSSTSTLEEYRGPNEKLSEIEVDSEKDQQIKHSPRKKIEETTVDVENKLPSTQKKDERDNSERLDSSSSTSTFEEYRGPNEKLSEIEVDSEEDQQIKHSPRKKIEETTVDVENKLTSEEQVMVNHNEMVDYGKVVRTNEDIDELQEHEILNRSGAEGLARAWSDVIKSDNIEENEIDEDASERKSTKSELHVADETLASKDPDVKESSVNPQLKMNAHLRKQVLIEIAAKNFLLGNKIFVYPEIVKPDQEVEVFLNRSISALKSEANVLIMGAFNGWKWKSYTIRLNKTELNGDWWSCRVYVPREAYQMDFVFFNGESVYENNDTKDFLVPVEGGMDQFTFEDFLLEERQRELDKIAAEKAERERQAEEQRRIEAEKVALEADRAQAKMEIEQRREFLSKVMLKAIRSVDNVWHIEPTDFKGEDLVRLYYNRTSGPLAHAKELWIHGGQNNWEDGLSIVSKLVLSERKDGDWWYAKVPVPDQARVLDWVFADGPPGNANLYDNNKLQDFHAIVPKCMPEELYWVEEEQRIFRQLQEERRLREVAIREKVERTARMKAETKERTIKTFLFSQKDIVYTEPLDVQAGSAVTVFYNPSNTVLNGKPEVWFRCSFNRWTHRRGPLPPQKMLPADNGVQVKATVKVPRDAYTMDFVFSEKETGGIYDNKNGMDYHVPVFGGVAKEPPMHIVHVAVEMAPIAKVGGLGDVVTSLSRAVQDLGHNVDIILPKYDCLNLSNVKDFQFHRSYAWGGTEIKVWFGKVEGLSVYFLEPQNGLFFAGCIYGCRNDEERFGFFCHAALEFLLQSGLHPDILHCHDWSSAPVSWLFKNHYVHYGLSKARVIFTIHNLEFGAPLIGKAMQFSDKASTVSNTYAKEISGNPVIAHHLQKFHGIRNGIDPDIWDPYNDKFLPISYTSDNVVEGKRAAKEALQQQLGLKASDSPLVGIITRLTVQKGIHLIKHAIWRTLERGGQVVLLGSAPDPRIQNDFVNLANQLHSSHGDRARLVLTYDEPLSHLIYAGSDFILVPSIFEPCGLTQLTAMRYGSIPVVRRTGGLYDTVFDVDNDKERAAAQGFEPNGFGFDGTDTGGVDYALNRAISAWYDGREWFNSLCKQVMEQDWSWNRPALDYMELYRAARK